MKLIPTKFAKIAFAATAMIAASLVSQEASAKVFFTDYDDAGVWHGYEDETQSYGMKFRSDQGKDGFWLVVSDGPNPKTNANEYAILYGDLNANKITAYTYDGENSANSYQTGELLGTYDNAFSSAGKHWKHGYDLTMFNLDVSAINNAFTTDDWDGVQLGATTGGIWFHQSAGSDFTYGEDGSILGYNFDSQMWVDDAFTQTVMIDAPDCGSENPYIYRVDSCNPTSASNTGGQNDVPAPGGLLLMATALAGLGLRRRK